MRTEYITSAQNPKIKDLLALQEKTKLRREKGLFVVEGRRELGHCLRAGFRIKTLFCCSEILCRDFHDGSYRLAKNDYKGLLDEAMEADVDAPLVVDIPLFIYDKVAYRGGTEGVIAEMEWKERELGALRVGDAPLVVVLEGVEKPGNLGAILRSADAAGADAVLICDPLTDLYNPNLVRASIGAVFTTQVACCSSEDAIAWLKSQGIQILTAQLQDSSWYYDTDMKKGTAIVIGTEATGLTDQWREAADAHIKIPMLGQLDSLNASVSAAILLFEAVRQRNS
ncbi:MAG: RNA methyltransferase [Bacteroidales bacterium]|nr:RNA methyltransferase [Bacteroidales bacterium]